MTTSLADQVDVSIGWSRLGAESLPIFAPPRALVEATTRLDLSENPFGCSPDARQAVLDEATRLHRYPDAAATDLIVALAQREGMTPAHFIAGNGIDELLLLSALALVDRPGGAVVSASTYPGHDHSVRATRRAAVSVPLRDLRVDVDRTIDAMRPGCVVYVCNPHNPTGTALTEAEIESLVRAARGRQAVLVIDEAYIEFAHPGETVSAIGHVKDGSPVIVLRTFSKIHGLAGLRCGYAVAPPPLCEELRRLKSVLVFNVNRLAAAAAVASLRDTEFVDSVCTRTRLTLVEFEEWLCGQRWAQPTRSVTNFILVELPWPAGVVSAELASRGVLVRDCTNLGLPNHVRVSVGEAHEMDLARAALIEVARFLDTTGMPGLDRR